MLHRLTLPPYNEIKHLEGKGNFAVDKYYKFPYRLFYRHKLRMALNLFPKITVHNVLDFGSGQGILVPELKKRALFVKQFDINDIIDKRWKFDVIVCCSVLEFCQLPHTLNLLKGMMKQDSKLIIASPMDTPQSRFYYKLIKDKNIRNSHAKILSEVSKVFKLETYTNWLNLYFALRASRH